MKIGFDVSQTGAGKAGCGFYADALARSLLDLAPECDFHFYPSFGDFYLDPRMSEACPFNAPRLDYGPRFETLGAAGDFWNSENLEFRLEHPDLIHANNFWCPLGLKDARLVYTFYDMAFLENADWSTEANRVGCFSGIFRAAVRADWIVAISESSRNHFLKIFPHFPEDRIRVIYPCSRFSDADRRGIKPTALEKFCGNDFWLSVGTIEPRKNQLGLARAYALYRENHEHPLPLVFAGGKGWLMDDFQKELKELGLLDHVILTGYVEDDELIWLYKNCFANLYPSFFEGFGLPVLEAMQFGAPTLASSTTSIPEVLGRSGILLDPSDPASWSREMLALERKPDLRQTMRDHGYQRVSQFNWKQSTQQLLDLYQEALLSPRRSPASCKTS